MSSSVMPTVGRHGHLYTMPFLIGALEWSPDSTQESRFNSGTVGIEQGLTMRTHYRGYRLGHNHQRKDWKKQQEFMCPSCLFSGKSEEEFKKHWKEKHAPQKGIEKDTRNRLIAMTYGKRGR